VESLVCLDGGGQAVALHPLLRARFSPLSFDPAAVISADDVDRLLEAARWAPSAGNSQPWGFVTALRGSVEHTLITRRLAASSARWAPTASLLVVNLAHHTFEDSELEYSEFSDYDLGQAVAHLTLQAQALGWACRQFRAFDLEGLSADLRVPLGWRIRSMTAVGRATGEIPPRERRPLADLLPTVAEGA
jgi:nitroreductase